MLSILLVPWPAMKSPGHGLKARPSDFDEG